MFVLVSRQLRPEPYREKRFCFRIAFCSLQFHSSTAFVSRLGSTIHIRLSLTCRRDIITCSAIRLLLVNKKRWRKKVVKLNELIRYHNLETKLGDFSFNINLGIMKPVVESFLSLNVFVFSISLCRGSKDGMFNSF